MNEVLILIRNVDSTWGTDVAMFTCPLGVTTSAVIEALEYAKCDIEENGISEETWMPELSEMILNRAANELGATWRWCSHVDFNYSYNGEWIEEEEE